MNTFPSILTQKQNHSDLDHFPNNYSQRHKTTLLTVEADNSGQAMNILLIHSDNCTHEILLSWVIPFHPLSSLPASSNNQQK